MCAETKLETTHWGGRWSQTENVRPDPYCRVFLGLLGECSWMTTFWNVHHFNWPDALPVFIIEGELEPEAE